MKSITLIQTSIIIDYSHRILLLNFIEFRKKLINFYRLLSNVIDYRYYQMTTPGILLHTVFPLMIAGGDRPFALRGHVTSFL